MRRSVISAFCVLCAVYKAQATENRYHLLARPNMSAHCDPYAHYSTITTRPAPTGHQLSPSITGRLISSLLYNSSYSSVIRSSTHLYSPATSRSERAYMYNSLSRRRSRRYQTQKQATIRAPHRVSRPQQSPRVTSQPETVTRASLSLHAYGSAFFWRSVCVGVYCRMRAVRRDGWRRWDVTVRLMGAGLLASSEVFGLAFVLWCCAL